MPSGVSFTDNLDGTATITGSADQGSQGTYPLTITASNGVAPDATQDFELFVEGQQPVILSSSAVTFAEGFGRTFVLFTSGTPTPSLSESGALPSGLSFADNLDGTGFIQGTADAGTAGTYPLTITASNGVLPDATQNFVLTVMPQPPNIPIDGSCSGLSMIGKLTPPLTAGPSAVTITAKNGLGTVVWGVGFGFQETTSTGSCDLNGFTYTGVQASTKLSGIGSCDANVSYPAVYPLNGKMTLSLATGALRSYAYIRIPGFDPVPGPDVVTVRGIVTKGVALGATIRGELFFDPVLQALANDDPVALGFGATPGQVLKKQFFFDDSQIAQTCGDGGNAISAAFIGDGVSLLGSPVQGLTFTYQPD